MAKDNRQKKAVQAAKKAAKQARKTTKPVAKSARPATRSTAPARSNTATRTAAAAAPRKKKKSGAPVGKIILTVLALLLLAAIAVFGITVWKFAKTYMDSQSSGGSEIITVEERDDVAYYLLGMLGEEKDDGKTGNMVMLSLVCYDKDAKNVQVMQIPPSTYLGDSEHFSANTVGGVWSKPKALKWCETCRKQVFEAEIKDGKHNATAANGKVCDTKITSKTGSSVNNLLEVFSHQYSINIDNYYILPQQAFVKLVDLVGGVDIKLSESQTLGETTYESGVQTLDGEGALEYVLGEAKSPKQQVSNLVHQRQVYVALFERLFTADETALNEDVLYPLMKGSTPIRTRRDNEVGEDVELMVKLLKDLNKLDRSRITLYMLPGEPTTLDGTAYYSVHKDELVTLLNNSFNPYGTPIAEEHLRMTEINDTEEANLQKQTYDKLLVKQSATVQAPEKDDEEE